MLFGFLGSFANLISFLKGTSRVSVLINVIVGCVFLAIGLLLLFRRAQPAGRNTGAWVCVSLGGLALVGALSTWLFAGIL